jgi:two-component system NarL family sensor kinase
LDDLGLAPALERLVADVRENHPITISLNVADLTDLRFPPKLESAIFRVAQEAMSNIVKHAQARNASLVVKLSDAAIQLDVTDDGIGIPASKLGGRNPGHIGLTGMRERITLLGGELSIECVPGHTQFTARLPIARVDARLRSA